MLADKLESAESRSAEQSGILGPTVGGHRDGCIQGIRPQDIAGSRSVWCTDCASWSEESGRAARWCREDLQFEQANERVKEFEYDPGAADGYQSVNRYRNCVLQV